MVYVTHDAETLQFYLWLADYYQRFKAVSPEHKKLSPKWMGIELQNHTKQPAYRLQGTEADKNLAGYIQKNRDLALGDIDVSSSTSLAWEGQQTRYSTTLRSMDPSRTAFCHVNPSPNLKWQVFAAQPFRAEIDRIAFHYIAPGSPRELKISHDDRFMVLYALQQTTDPSAFTTVKRLLDSYLRNQAHPSFVRWSVCNGNRHRTIFLRCFACMNITFGFIIAIVLTLSSASRYWRIFAAVEWWFGITSIITSYQGLCVLLHRMHVRNVRPWELDESAGEAKNSSEEDEEAGWTDHNLSYKDTKPKWPVKMEIFGPANRYDTEDWVKAYPKLSLWKRVSNRKVIVKRGGGLGVIQDKVIRQAEAWALVITIPLTVGFCCIPPGNFF